MYYTPSASHSLSSSPRGGAKGALRHENRFLSDTSPGGLGKYRIRTIFAATLKMLSAQKPDKLSGF